MPNQLEILNRQIVQCDRCPRLRRHCVKTAETKRRAFAEWDYWGKPVAGFGDPRARLWIIGLAPGAHGANRTGRVFTGDRSGDFLYAALHRAGFANQPASRSRDDGLALENCYISAVARCAPPGNKPLPCEVAQCAEYLDREWDLLKRKRVVLALGKIAWDGTVAMLRRKLAGMKSASAFGHGATCEITPTLKLVGSYHVSQQNTFTGRLTPQMFDAVLRQCRAGW